MVDKVNRIIIHKITSLDLSDDKNLTTLPESIGKLVNLTSLDLRYCRSLTTLPDSISKLVNLTSLELYSCYATVPKSITDMPKLKIYK